MARRVCQTETGSTGRSSMLHRQACKVKTAISAPTASATHHQFMVRRSFISAPNLKWRRDHASTPIAMTFVSTSSARACALPPLRSLKQPSYRLRPGLIAQKLANVAVYQIRLLVHHPMVCVGDAADGQIGHE